jgi:hypothetical protein
MARVVLDPCSLLDSKIDSFRLRLTSVAVVIEVKLRQTPLDDY